MMMYPAYIALVVSFVLVIVLHAWFVRRLSSLHDRANAARTDHHHLRMEAVELAETVNELNRGKDSNALSVQMLKGEIEEIKVRIREFLAEHEEMQEEYGDLETAIAEDTTEEEELEGKPEGETVTSHTPPARSDHERDR